MINNGEKFFSFRHFSSFFCPDLAPLSPLSRRHSGEGLVVAIIRENRRESRRHLVTSGLHVGGKFSKFCHFAQIWVIYFKQPNSNSLQQQKITWNPIKFLNKLAHIISSAFIERKEKREKNWSKLVKFIRHSTTKNKGKKINKNRTAIVVGLDGEVCGRAMYRSWRTQKRRAWNIEISNGKDQCRSIILDNHSIPMHCFHCKSCMRERERAETKIEKKNV